MAADTKEGSAMFSPTLPGITTDQSEDRVQAYNRSATRTAARKLAAAARLIGDAHAQRLVVGDRGTARRYYLLAGAVRDEAEVLEGVAVHDLIVPTPTYPPGATIGWLARHDAATRALRRAAGLTVPEVDRG